MQLDESAAVESPQETGAAEIQERMIAPVVGIVAGQMDGVQVAGATGDITQNANFAVNLGTIQSFLDNHAVAYVANESTEIKDYVNIAAEAMRYTVLLECAD